MNHRFSVYHLEWRVVIHLLLALIIPCIGMFFFAPKFCTDTILHFWVTTCHQSKTFLSFLSGFLEFLAFTPNFLIGSQLRTIFYLIFTWSARSQDSTGMCVFYFTNRCLREHFKDEFTVHVTSNMSIHRLHVDTADDHLLPKPPSIQ